MADRGDRPLGSWVCSTDRFWACEKDYGVWSVEYITVDLTAVRGCARLNKHNAAFVFEVRQDLVDTCLVPVVRNG